MDKERCRLEKVSRRLTRRAISDQRSAISDQRSAISDRPILGAGDGNELATSFGAWARSPAARNGFYQQESIKQNPRKLFGFAGVS